MGLIGHVLQPLHLDITSVLMSAASFIAKPARWLQAITDHRATISGAPNFAYELCTRRVTGDQMRTLDLGCWDGAFNGSEMVRAETLERFADKFASCGFRRKAFVSCYGLAEATLLVSASPASTFPAVRRLDGEELQQHRVRPASQGARNVRSAGAAATAAAARVDRRPRDANAVPGRSRRRDLVRGSVAPGYGVTRKQPAPPSTRNSQATTDLPAHLSTSIHRRQTALRDRPV
jgi:acyl-CoA synthetase (AMP-forming)/AMP-acid ligase II